MQEKDRVPVREVFTRQGGLVADLCALPHEILEDIVPPGWQASTAHYAYLAAASPRYPTILLSLDAIEPPRRDPDAIGFDTERLRSLAKGIVSGDAIPPVEVTLPAADLRYQYRLHDGFHRFYLSKDFGFRMIPATLVELAW